MLRARTARPLLLLSLALSAGLAAPPARAQQPPDPPKGKRQTDSATKNAPDQPMWDPLRAEKDLEVGQYYLKRGNLDAAIDRFEDAALAKPGYALPFRYLGEAQERKGLKREAVKSYRRYLDLYPHAEDRDRIEKRIARLRQEAESGKHPAR